MATATARLDAPRLAALVGAALVVVLTSSARPEEAPLVSSDPVVAPGPRPSVAPPPSAPPAPPAQAATSSEPSAVTEDALRGESPRANVEDTAAPEGQGQAVPPLPVATPEEPPAAAPPASTWTHFDPPRVPTVRGRQLALKNLSVEKEGLVGQRADGPFVPGGPTLLVHYASWCLPCAEELPEVLALARSLTDISKIEKTPSSDISKVETNAAKSPHARPARPHRLPTVVFVSHDEVAGPQALLASFEDLLAKARLKASDLPAGLSLRADPDGRFFNALTRGRFPLEDPSALPSLWLLDQRGRLLAHLSGPLTADHRESLLAALEALR